MKHSWNISFNPLFVCLLKRSTSNNWNDGHGLIKSHRYNHSQKKKGQTM